MMLKLGLAFIAGLVIIFLMFPFVGALMFGLHEHITDDSHWSIRLYMRWYPATVGIMFLVFLAFVCITSLGMEVIGKFL